MLDIDGSEGGGQLLRSGLALAGGGVRIPAVTDHVESSLSLLAAFGFDVTLEESGPAPLVTAR
jgi:RNA 3'-terminal phosphate cyclase (ATP)